MEPWVVDAGALDIASGVESFQKQLLHTNRIAQRFLDDNNVHNLIVVATKGYGKTLLLKAKRVRIEYLRATTKPGIQIIPDNNLVDKPISTPRILAYDSIALLLQNVDYWKDIWLMSISLAVCKKHSVSLHNLPDVLFSIWHNGKMTSIFDIFARLIALNKREVHSAQKALLDELIPSFRQIHSPTYVFIDNVDEYFSSCIIASSKQRPKPNHLTRHPLYGAADRSFWYMAQIGLAIAVRELSTINAHVKVCASLRAEAMQKTHQYTEVSGQIRGMQIDITYSKDDLMEILKKNIAQVEPYLLSSSDAKNLYARFFGEDCTSIMHPRTGEVEPIEDYFIRHTLWRPRDIATLGRAVQDITTERRTPQALAYAINGAAREIVKDYESEVTPHLKNFNLPLISSLIHKNIISKREAQALSSLYEKTFSEMFEMEDDGENIFASLYKIGLVGCVSEERRTRKKMQKFCVPGELPLDEKVSLPDSPYYLIHPIFDEYIAIQNQNYWNNMDKLNIVGKDRPWRVAADVLFVLHGDVVGSGGKLLDEGERDVFLDVWRRVTGLVCKDLDYYEVIEGDGILLVDKNASSVVAAAEALNRQLWESPVKRKVRFGGDCGIVTVNSENRQSGKSARGRPLVVAARIQRLASGDHIYVSGAFHNWAKELGSSLEFEQLNARDLRHVRCQNSLFDIAKDGDPEMLTPLFLTGE